MNAAEYTTKWGLAPNFDHDWTDEEIEKEPERLADLMSVCLGEMWVEHAKKN